MFFLLSSGHPLDQQASNPLELDSGHARRRFSPVGSPGSWGSIALLFWFGETSVARAKRKIVFSFRGRRQSARGKGSQSRIVNMLCCTLSPSPSLSSACARNLKLGKEAEGESFVATSGGGRRGQTGERNQLSVGTKLSELLNSHKRTSGPRNQDRHLHSLPAAHFPAWLAKRLPNLPVG